jgi:hypothetical protein
VFILASAKVGFSIQRGRSALQREWSGWVGNSEAVTSEVMSGFGATLSPERVPTKVRNAPIVLKNSSVG